MEVILVQRALQYRAHESDLLSFGLQCQHTEALFNEHEPVEVFVADLKGVVGELCLVHQVSHERHHHFGLTSHVLELALGFADDLQEFVHHLDQVVPFAQNQLHVFLVRCQEPLVLLALTYHGEVDAADAADLE